MKGPLLITATVLTSAAFHAQAAPRVIELTQVACQFVESENGTDHGFRSAKAADCERMNADTGSERLAAATVINETGQLHLSRA